MPYVDLHARKSKVLGKDDRLREVSTDEQLRQGRAWADRHGYTVRREWVELGSAYAERERPEFKGAVDAVLSGETDALWSYMIDRFSRRGAEDVLKVIGKGRVIFDYDHLDSADERDRERIIIEAERARTYSHRLSVRVTDVKSSMRDRGEWVSGSPPWGMDIDPRTRKLYPDGEIAGGYVTWLSKADLLREIVYAIIGGASIRRIVWDLNRLKVPSPRGKQWSAPVLSRLVRSPALIGLQVVHVKGTATNAVYRDESGNTVSVGVGVITAEEQRLALEALHRPTTGTEKPGGRAKYLLTGLLRCNACARPMSYTGSAYRCSSMSSRQSCPAPAVATAKAIEAYISTRWLERLTALSPDDPLAVTVAHRWAALKAPKLTAELAAAREAVTAAQTVRARLQRAYRAGAYDGAEDLFAEEMRDATRSVKEAEAALSEHEEPTPDASWIDDPDVVYGAWQSAGGELRRDLLRLAIDRITVRKAEYRGQQFDGDIRCDIEWAEHESL